MSDVHMKVRAALAALAELEDDLRIQAVVQQEEEDSAHAAFDEEEAHFTEWAEDLHAREERLERAIDWARGPNPSMSRPMQRLVLRTLLFDVAPQASYNQISLAADRMLP